MTLEKLQGMYPFVRELPGGDFLAIAPLTFERAQLRFGCTEFGFNHNFTYETLLEAIAAAVAFDPATMREPVGWIRCDDDGRRRPDKTPASERTREQERRL